MLFFSTSLIIYLLIRAYMLSFTHDESLSYTIIEGKMKWMFTANNHPLNTILMFISKLLFGNSEFFFRLPNVLSSLLYLTGCFYIFKQSKNNWLLLLGFSLALFQPFLIEFFSLARGYGMSLGFMLMSMFYVLKNERYTTYSTLRKDLIYSAVYGAFAVAANLVMVNYFISLLLLFSIKFWLLQQQKREVAKNNKDFLQLLAISCIPLTIGIAILMVLKRFNQLYYGATSFESGMDALISTSIYFPEYVGGGMMSVKFILIMALLLGALLLFLNRKLHGGLFYTMLLIVFWTIGIWLEHILFGAKFPQERTALFYIPLMAVFFYYLFSELITVYKINKLVYIPVILSIILPLCLNFVAGANIKHTKTWRYDAHTKEAMTVIRDYTKNSDHNVTISNNWLFEPTLNFYINTWKLKMDPAPRNGIHPNSDFIYQLDSDSILAGYDTLMVYKKAKSALLIKTETKRK